MYNDFIFQNKRRIIIGISVFFALIIIWAVWTYIDRAGKTPFTISVVPSDAKVLIDGKNIGNGTHWLLDKTYKVSVQKDGFAPEHTTIEVTNKKSQNILAFSLEPQSNEAKKWAADHQNDYKKNEQFGALAARSNGEYFTEQNPITKNLPFTDPYFNIGYRVTGDQSIVLTVSTPSPRYRFYAVEKIRQLGYEPTDFVIEFKDFKNPLGEKK